MTSLNGIKEMRYQVQSLMKRSVLILYALAITFAMPLGVGAALYMQSLPQTQLLHDGNLHLFLIGTGCPQAEMQSIRKPACIVVIADGKVLLFDAGEGAIQTIAALGLPYELISTAFITHWHSDHFAGLAGVVNASWDHGRKVPFEVYGPFGTKQVIDGLNKAYELDALFRSATVHGFLDASIALSVPHELIDVKAEGKEVYSTDGNGLTVTAFAVDHSPVVPAFGYVIKYHGTKIVISGDTCVVKSLEQQSENADLLISEAFSRPLSDKEKVDARSTQVVTSLRSYHADSLELAKMAQRAGVKRLIVTHLVPAIPTAKDAKQAFIKGMDESYKGPITVADDGDHIIVKPTSSGTCEIQYVPHPQPDTPCVPAPHGVSPLG